MILPSALGGTDGTPLSSDERAVLESGVSVRWSGGQPLSDARPGAALEGSTKEDLQGGLVMPRSLLVVDDEPNILLCLEFLMKKEGHDVRIARDGEEALAEISKSPPDLVLLDVMMPKRNGFDVCETIRANPDWKDMRVVMLTAKGRDVEREKGFAAGADDYITKPFSTRDVVERVNGWLGVARA
jgi:two-component system, OmpR family, alkaline phosphatase synthesis response regulator PhoP